MRPHRLPRSLAPAGLGATATLLAMAASACGSSGPSSSHAQSTPATGTSPAATTPTTGAPTSTAPRRPRTTPAAPPSGAGTGGAQAPAGGGAAAAGGRSAAIAVVARQGYTVSGASSYRADQTLRVLVGTTGRKTTGRVQRAFFFVNERYIGTDAGTPSAAVSVVGQDDTSVTLSYRLFRPRDPLCCPTGGRRSVRFALDNGRLAPGGPIPTDSPRAALSRR
jgi:hypothetical protein